MHMLGRTHTLAIEDRDRYQEKSGPGSSSAFSSAGLDDAIEQAYRRRPPIFTGQHQLSIAR
jgi:hypothetical protein